MAKIREVDIFPLNLRIAETIVIVQKSVGLNRLLIRG